MIALYPIIIIQYHHRISNYHLQEAATCAIEYLMIVYLIF